MLLEEISYEGIGRNNVNIKVFLKTQCFASFNFHIFKMLIQGLQTYKKLDVFNFHRNILEPHLYNFRSTLRSIKIIFLLYVTQ